MELADPQGEDTVMGDTIDDGANETEMDGAPLTPLTSD